MNYFRQVHGLNTVALRYANMYGPRQNAHGEAGVVAIFAQRMLAGKPVTNNGNGEQTRDFVYVGDVVAANLMVADSAEEGPFNVGTGNETTINELYLMMRELIPGRAGCGACGGEGGGSRGGACWRRRFARHKRQSMAVCARRFRGLARSADQAS